MVHTALLTSLNNIPVLGTCMCWAGHGLSFMGRAYNAEQILMAQFVYHATFFFPFFFLGFTG